MDLEKQLKFDNKRFNKTWLAYWSFIDNNHIEVWKLKLKNNIITKDNMTENGLDKNKITNSPIKKSSRPTFYLNNDKTLELKAGGILFYKYNEGQAEFEILMINSRNNYEDFGGCNDISDKDIRDTVSREVEEESNNIFNKKDIKEKLESLEPIYIKNSKYALYFVQLDEYVDPKDFGDKEIHDDLDRTVEWIPYSKFDDQDFLNKLNFRLKSFSVLNYLKKILIKP